MNLSVIILLVFITIYLCLNYYYKTTLENYLPYTLGGRIWHHNPPRRNMPYDLRCVPHVPKKNFIWNNSPYDYYYRPKCLVMR